MTTCTRPTFFSFWLLLAVFFAHAPYQSSWVREVLFFFPYGAFFSLSLLWGGHWFLAFALGLVSDAIVGAPLGIHGIFYLWMLFLSRLAFLRMLMLFVGLMVMAFVLYFFAGKSFADMMMAVLSACLFYSFILYGVTLRKEYYVR